MTTPQLTALATGFVAFLAVWSTLLVPQLILHTARYGRIVVTRVATTAAQVLYACLGLAVVLLPLPGPRTRSVSESMQLVPFQWISDTRHELAGSSLVDAFMAPAFQQAALNVVLFVPLGIFARMLWRRGFVGAVVLGFGCSLLVEVTQLTANWGTAPFQYRIFDVDDLMTNTTGAALGWITAALVVALRASARRSEPVRQRVHLTNTRQPAPPESATTRHSAARQQRGTQPG